MRNRDIDDKQDRPPLHGAIPTRDPTRDKELEPHAPSPGERAVAESTAEELRVALRESEVRHRALLASILDPLISIDEQGTIREVSASVERVFGYAPHELVGQNVKILMTEPHRAQHDGYLANYRTTGRASILNRTREFDVVRKDGTSICCDLSVSRIEPGASGEVRFVGTFRDVTERKAAEAALRRSEQRFHAIFDGTYQYLGLLAPDGTLLEANQTALDATGVTRATVIGQPFWEGPWWSDSQATRERIHSAIVEAASGKFVRFEVQVRARDGALIDVDFSIKPVKDERGLVTLLIPEGRDITELKRVQRAETTMLRALAAIGESSALLAHEIKNPITAVNVALRAVADQLGEDHREVLADLVARMQRVQALMQRTLSFAKPLELHRIECDAVQLVRDTIAHLAAQIAEARATVTIEAARDVRVACDTGLLEEVIANLIVNAMESRGRGARVEVGVSAEGSRGVRFTVDDDGPGINEQLRTSLFKPFVSTKVKGTGIGLAICKKIIEEHGGSIRVETSRLGGARFVISLPTHSGASG